METQKIKQEVRRIMEPFAKAAFSIEQDRKRLKSNDKQIKSLLNHLIDRCIRTSSNLIPPSVSEAAHFLAKKHNINLLGAKEKQKRTIETTLKQLGEKDYFFYEHKTTVFEMRKQIERCKSLDQVLDVFCQQEIVWILNSENEKLIQNGNNSRREFHESAYEQAGINVIKTHYNLDEWSAASWRITL